MEEADARLQEVVASLLNEHGGNHEPALRQTFACLHNSGLYEAQSPQEEEQREQQARPIFVASCVQEGDDFILQFSKSLRNGTVSVNV